MWFLAQKMWGLARTTHQTARPTHRSLSNIHMQWGNLGTIVVLERLDAVLQFFGIMYHHLSIHLRMFYTVVSSVSVFAWRRIPAQAEGILTGLLCFLLRRVAMGEEKKKKEEEKSEKKSKKEKAVEKEEDKKHKKEKEDEKKNKKEEEKKSKKEKEKEEEKKHKKERSRWLGPNGWHCVTVFSNWNQKSQNQTGNWFEPCWTHDSQWFWPDFFQGLDLGEDAGMMKKMRRKDGLFGVCLKKWPIVLLSNGVFEELVCLKTYPTITYLNNPKLFGWPTMS